MITKDTKDFIEFTYADNYYIYRKSSRESFQTWYHSEMQDYIWNGISDDRPLVAELKIHLKKLLRLEKLERIIED